MLPVEGSAVGLGAFGLAEKKVNAIAIAMNDIVAYREKLSEPKWKS